MALAVRAGLAIPKNDPLRYRRISSAPVRQAIEWMLKGVLTYLHGGNSSGKTEGLADPFVRLCRGQPSMDGRLMTRAGEDVDPEDEIPRIITLPGLRNGEAWRHWVLVQSYDQAKDSSMRAYRKLVGKHPHDISWLAKGLPKRIRVKPDVWNSDDPETWSEITGMTDEDVQRVQGARVHSIHCDEMPLLSILEELLNRADANTDLLFAITATPEYKHEWEPILNMFLACYGRPVGGRARIQCPVTENRALSFQHLNKIWDRNKGATLFKARWDGEHVDVSGGCPFPYAPIERLLTKCQPGRTERYILREGDEESDVQYAEALVERWLPYNPRHRYLGIADTSRGIDDGKHDPCELQIWDWTEPMMVCRYGMRAGVGGYLDEDALAILANMLGREYKAMIDWEVVGGWGMQFGATLRKLRYPNLAHDDRTLSPGVIMKEYGWNANPNTNAEIVAALQKGLNDASFKIWSADAVSQWKDVREDEKGRPANVRKGARHHRESMVCAGRALHWIQTRSAGVVPEFEVENDMETALRQSFGRKIEIPSMRGRVGRGLPEIFRPDLT
jgi:hypothetical protein